MILDTSSTIEINVIISSAYQNTPGPAGHTNVWVGSEATITLHGIGSAVYGVYYSDLNHHVSIKEKQNQNWPDSNIFPSYHWGTLYNLVQYVFHSSCSISG